MGGQGGGGALRGNNFSKETGGGGRRQVKDLSKEVSMLVSGFVSFAGTS